MEEEDPGADTLSQGCEGRMDEAWKVLEKQQGSPGQKAVTATEMGSRADKTGAVVLKRAPQRASTVTVTLRAGSSSCSVPPHKALAVGTWGRHWGLETGRLVVAGTDPFVFSSDTTTRLLLGAIAVLLFAILVVMSILGECARQSVSTAHTCVCCVNQCACLVPACLLARHIPPRIRLQGRHTGS